MEFPGRVLDQNQYLYNTSTVYSTEIKPPTVAEAEFRLTDGLLDVAQIVNGPSGRSFVTSYTRAINSLMPKWDESKLKFRKNQEKIRKWLLTKVNIPVELAQQALSDQNPSCETLFGEDHFKGSFFLKDEATLAKGSAVGSLLELHRMLMANYEKARIMWDICRLKVLQRVEAGNTTDEERDDALRRLSVLGLTAQERIDNYWTDVVVRGYHHYVKEALSYLDIETDAELIEKSKQKMRQSEALSIDQSTSIWPVKLEPANWADHLTTRFTPEDLLLNWEQLGDRAGFLQARLNSLGLQKALATTVQRGDVDEARKRVVFTKQALDAAHLNMTRLYGRAAGEAAKIYLEHKYGVGVPAKNPVGNAEIKEAVEAIGKKDGSGPMLKPEEVTELVQLYNSAVGYQVAFNRAAEDLAESEAALAVAESTTHKESLAAIDAEIGSVGEELQKVRTLLETTRARHSAGGSLSGNETGPVEMPSMPSAGPWTQVVLTFEKDSTSSNTSLDSSTVSTGFNYNTLFRHVSASYTSSQSASKISTDMSRYRVEIAFEATKVDINRGGWFMPEVFLATESMIKVNTRGLSISGPNPLDAKTLFTDPELVKTLPKWRSSYLFPMYPISFLVARDVSIKIVAEESFSSDFKQYIYKGMSASSSFLCFSARVGMSKLNTNTAYAAGFNGNTLRIKIPGAQILGWFQEMVPEDNIALLPV
eukprot:m51a1_g11467 hypothetical protein (706) ;mRNA; f:6268-8619